MQEVPPRPWSVGLRLRTEPEGARHYRVGVGSRADGRTVGELHRAEDVWISLIVRDDRPLRVRADTVLQAGDEVLLLAEPPTEPGSAFEPR